MSSFVQIDRDGAIVWLTLHRPGVRNALNADVLNALDDALDRASDDRRVRAVVLTGAGPAFSAGADIEALHASTPQDVRTLALKAVSVTRRLETSGLVTVAAINGDALGGGLELAEACMLRIAVHGARLGHPEVRIGAIAGFGGTTRLPRLIGRTRAAKMLLTGDLISADEAQRVGLVNDVVEADALRAHTTRLLDRILSQSASAVRLTWDALHRGASESVEASATLGADLFGVVASTGEFREGTAAFLEKRAPDFASTRDEEAASAADA